MLELITKFSSLKKIQCTTAYCLRFTKPFFLGLVAKPEPYSALLHLVYLVQQIAIHSQITKLERQKLLHKQLRQLTAFIDDAGIVRVGIEQR